MLQEMRAHVQRDRGLPKPNENHMYLEKPGEKGAEDGQWVGELWGGAGPGRAPNPCWDAQILHRNPQGPLKASHLLEGMD